MIWTPLALTISCSFINCYAQDVEDFSGSKRAILTRQQYIVAPATGPLKQLPDKNIRGGKIQTFRNPLTAEAIFHLKLIDQPK